MHEDKFILSEFKKAIRAIADSDLVDFDSKFPHRFDFQIQKLEDVFSETNRRIPPNRWSYYRIVLLKKGSADFNTGVYSFKAVKNSVVVIPPRIVSSSRNWSLDLEGYVLLFNLDFFLQNSLPYKLLEDKKILSPFIHPQIQLSEDQAGQVEKILKIILNEKDGKRVHKDELIAIKIIELIIISERFFSQKQNFEENLPSIDITKKFIELVEANFLHERSVAFYASRLNVHPNYLNAVIKKTTGVTAKESIQNRLLLETKFLLHSTKLTIKEIANQVGFSDPNYFTVFFKRCENVSPANYRSSNV